MAQQAVLNNPLLLSQIFEKLDFNGKKNFRLVHTSWRNVSMRQWRKNVEIKINDANQRAANKRRIKDVVTKLRARNTRSTPSIFNLLDEYPFRRYHIKLYDQFHLPPLHEFKVAAECKKNPAVSEKYFKYFFKNYGSSLESLTLEGDPMFRRGQVPEMFQWLLLKAFVNLKKFSLKYYRLDYVKLPSGLKPLAQNVAPELVELDIISSSGLSKGAALTCTFSDEVEIAREILKLVPNLKILKLEAASVAIAGALKFPRRDGSFIKLESLTLDLFCYYSCRWAGDVITSLHEYVKLARFPLKNIALTVTTEEIRKVGSSFPPFLKGCASTNLTKLKLCMRPSNNQMESTGWVSDFTGIDFPNLTHLIVNSSEVVEHPDEVALKFDFRCWSRMPKLEVFRCKIRSGVVHAINFPYLTPPQLMKGGFTEDELDMPPFELKRLQEFSFYANQKFSRESLQLLSAMMPSVRKLSLVVNDEILPVVVEQFTELRKINMLHDSHVTIDPFISALSPNDNIVVDGVLSYGSSTAIFFS